ncbi:MAG: AAA family ATPase [Deltaproteobacteria bacterium]|nr:MAG: AAA family ATPase [Deltaproteobacteria bacterium]
MTRDERLALLSELWRKERDTTRARFEEERRGASLSVRVERGLALRNLSLDELSPAPGTRLTAWLSGADEEGLDTVRLGPGTPVRLWWDDPEQESAVPAVVARRRGARIAVVIDEAYPARLDEGSFHLDVDAPQTTFTRGERAIASFRDPPKDDPRTALAPVLFDGQAPEFGETPEVTFFDEALHEAQRIAVGRALSAKTIALIHGPPGTGKTRTLTEVVRQAVHRGDRVLVTAASNTAVDNLAERLAAAGTPVVRLGHPARVSTAMEPRTLDALLGATDAFRLARTWTREANALRRRVDSRSSRRRMDRRERRELLGESRRLMRDARKYLNTARRRIVDGAPIIAATAAGADSRILGDGAFDLVVLDEATQATDPLALAALGRGPRAVLAGDPQQLPPTVIDLEAARAGLGRTLFERLAESSPGAAVLLTLQHRMHEALMRFPSETMYGGRLEAAPEVANHTLRDIGITDDPLRPGPLVFVDTAGRGWEESRGADDPSVRNVDQGARTAAEVRRLLRRGIAPTDVAVITPYYAQARLLREALKESYRDGLEIGTVDGFQGREKEAVVVDLVRSNDNGELGFLTETRRMNVAITRARRFLLVIGDSATLGAHPYYQKLLTAFEESGAWISAWADDPDALF